LDVLEMYVLLPVVVGVLWFGLLPAPHMERIETQAQVATMQLERATLPPGGPTLSDVGGAR
jgi:NADH:ubiquinone oxidoreductase subunit 4 (subunit M)